MDRQFFISHSSVDARLAEALVEELESSGYKCWIASRDASEGPDSKKPVNSVILESAAVLLVFTENTADSSRIRSELDISANQRIPIIPLKFREAPISKSISYYTHSRKWIDCTVHQANTREIMKTLFALAKEPPPREQPVSSRGKKRKWILASVLLFVTVITSLLLALKTVNTDPADLINVAVGGRDSWDYASSINPGTNGGMIVTGAWDWGYWSEIWVTQFDNTGRLIFSWSDSISGDCKPVSIPTYQGGSITVYASFSEADERGFTFRAVNLTDQGSILWETEQRIDHPGGDQPSVASLHWLPGGRAVASFSLRSSSDNLYSAHLAKIDATNGSMEVFTIPGNIRTGCTAVSAVYERILHVSEGEGNGGDVIRVLDWEGRQNDLIQLDPGVVVSCAEYRRDNTLILSGLPVNGSGTVWTACFSEDMEMIWEIAFNEIILSELADMTILPDGSILLAGSIDSSQTGESDGVVLRLDKEGKLLWKTVIDEEGDNHILSVATREDRTILLAGTTTAFGDRDAWFMEMTRDGQYSSTCALGIELLTEGWEAGFIEHSLWSVVLNEESPQVLIEDDSTGNFALVNCNAPVVLNEPVPLVPGLCFSAEISVPSETGATESNWISIGTAEHGLSTAPQGSSDCELRWNYSPEQEFSATFGRSASCSLLTVQESQIITRSEPQLFSIENCSDSVLFLINDSLLWALPSENNPDSLKFFINGSSPSVPHMVDNVRIYLRKW
ncbi:MAG: TIR domain-containing protein [Candidatus Sabulitectum sp.]|nr:TIR domain-containing protein [Candidatus Sabulitectum sp.]